MMKGTTWLFIVALVAIVVGFVLFNPLSFLAAESYYEYRCEDVAPYKTLGYTLDHIDDNGCEIVKKQIVASSIQCVRPEYIQNCPGSCCSNNPCQELGVCQSYQLYTKYTYTTDYRGGYIRVENKCEYGSNQLLAVETFSAGSISKLSTRYPVAGFCKAHPAIWMVGNTSQTSTTVYDDLLAGKSISIPSGQTLTLFYVIENNYQLPTVCVGGQALSVESNKCVAATGMVYVCSIGQFDPALGLCVVQVTEQICTQGRLVKNAENSYSCVYNPPLQAECARGYYSVDSDTCKYYADQTFVCAKGTLHTPDQSECLVNGHNWLSCPNCPPGQLCVGGCGTARCDEGQYCVVETTRTVTQEVINNVVVEVTHLSCADSGATLVGEECRKVAVEKLVCADGGIVPNSDGVCVTTQPSLITYSCSGTWSDSSHTTCLIDAPIKYRCGTVIIDDPSQCFEDVVPVTPGGEDVVEPKSQNNNLIFAYCFVGLIVLVIFALFLVRKKR